MGKETDGKDSYQRFSGYPKNLLGLAYTQQAVASPIGAHAVQHQDHYSRDNSADRPDKASWKMNMFANRSDAVDEVPEPDCDIDHQQVCKNFAGNRKPAKIARGDCSPRQSYQLQVQGGNFVRLHLRGSTSFD